MNTVFFFTAFASRLRPQVNQILTSSAEAESDNLLTLLSTAYPVNISPDQIHSEIEGNLWMLTPEAFQYFLPAFLKAGIDHYCSLGNFVAELVAALTKPMLDDIYHSFERLAQIPSSLGLSPETIKLLQQQQLDWYKSGAPLASFMARIDGLSDTEGSAILAFLVEIKNSHGEDFPFGEAQIAIDRHWEHYLPLILVAR